MFYQLAKYGHYGLRGGHGLLGLIFWIVIIVLIVKFIKRGSFRHLISPRNNQAVESLQLKYVNGEIDKETYESKMIVLRESMKFGKKQKKQEV